MCEPGTHCGRYSGVVKQTDVLSLLQNKTEEGNSRSQLGRIKTNIQGREMVLNSRNSIVSIVRRQMCTQMCRENNNKNTECVCDDCWEVV